MPKKINKKNLYAHIIESVASKMVDLTLSPVISFDNYDNENNNFLDNYDNENITLKNIDLNNLTNLNIPKFYTALQNSTKEEQLSFFKNNFSQNLENAFKVRSIEAQCLFRVLYYDSVKFIIENGINLLKISPIRAIAESDYLTLQEKINLLETYYLKIDYQTVEDIIALISSYHNQDKQKEINERFNYLKNNVNSSLNIKNYYTFSKETYSKKELDELFSNIKKLNSKRISLNDILYKLFLSENIKSAINLLNEYDKEITKRILKKEKFKNDIVYFGNFEILKIFLIRYSNILFVNNNLNYGMSFYILFFKKAMIKGHDIMKYFPLFSINTLDNEDVRKIIIREFNYDLPICKYFLETKADFKDITLCLDEYYYNTYFNYFFKLEKNLRNKKISLKEIKNIKTIYSNDYIKLLSYLNKYNNKEIYDFGYKIFIKDIKKFVKVKDSEEEYEKLMKLYYKNCINGFPLSKLLYFNDEIELNIHQKFKKEFDVVDIYDINKIKIINAKEYLKIIKKYESKYKIDDKEDFEYLILKGLLVFPYDKLNIILDNINGEFITILEKLFKDIDTNKVVIDDNKIIYNKKMINLIFKNNQKFNTLDNNNDLVIYFTYIYNYWDDIIKFYKTKNISLKMAKNFVKEKFFVDKKIPPIYNDLKDYLYYITHDEKFNIDKNVFEILDKYYLDMKMRYYATIPQVNGKYNGYHYEMLNTNDPFALAVGKLTNCCFRIDGHAKTALHYTMLNPDNRIFCVWKNNELVAQSWVWRKGNYLCFDNIECIKKEVANANIWVDCYIEATKKIYLESLKKEKDSERIKIITLGRNPKDVVIEKLNFYKKIENKEQLVVPTSKIPDEIKTIYTDANYKQIVLYKEKDFLIENNNDDCNYIYLDKRDKIKQYDLKRSILVLNELKDKIIGINDIINKEIPMDNIINGVVSKDWYYCVDKENNSYSAIFSYDPRAHHEYEKYLMKVNRR